MFLSDEALRAVIASATVSQDGGAGSRGRFSASNGDGLLEPHVRSARPARGGVARRALTPSTVDALLQGQCTERSVRVVTPAAKLSPV